MKSEELEREIEVRIKWLESRLHLSHYEKDLIRFQLRDIVRCNTIER